MKRYIILLCYVLVSIVGASAQVLLEENYDVVGDFRNIFTKLETNRIVYAALRDRAVELEDFDLYDGNHLDEYSTRDSYLFLLKSVRTLYATCPSWQAESVLYEQEQQNNLSLCTVSVLLYNYMQIKENALKDSLIRYDGEYVYDKYDDNGVWKNPYEEGVLFAMAPSDTIFSNSVTFSFPNTLFKTNTGASFEFDADDGNGFQTIRLSSSPSVSVVYSTAGEHILRLRFEKGGVVYYTQCKISTISEPITTRAFNEDLVKITEISTSYMGQTIEGKLHRYIRSTNHLKPFLIVEGFDISINTNLSEVKNKSGYGLMSLKTIGEDLSSIIDKYDVYYLDLKDPTLKIEANSVLLEEALSYIEQDKATYESYDENIILGSSMGGLIVRYCLRDMELHSKLHHTHTIICQDTPNLGANVPLGILYSVHGLKKIYARYENQLYGPAQNSMRILNSIVDSDAAREMLINYVDEDGEIDNSVHEAFMQKLHTMGYPVGDNGTLRTLAISNGNEVCLDKNEPIFQFTGSYSAGALVDLLLNTICLDTSLLVADVLKSFWTGVLWALPGHSRVKCDIEINPVGSTASDNLTLLSLQYTKKLLWLVDLKSNIFKYKKKQISGIINYDIARTSYYDANNIISQESYEYFYNSALLGNIKVEMKRATQIPFIPTVSALDVGEGKTPITQSDLDTVYSMQGARPGGTKYIPFDGYYITKYSGQHISLNSDILNWIQGQLQLSVEGDEIGSTGSQYSLINNTEGLSVEWSSSDQTIATIDQNGVLTSYKHGYITLKATLSNGLAFPKYVMVDFPKYNISVTNYAKNIGFIYNQYSDNDANLRMFKPYIKYQVAGSDVCFKDTDNNYCYVERSSNGGRAYVYFRSVYTSKTGDRYSEIVSSSAVTAYPYILEPTYFILSDYYGISSVELKKNPYYNETLPDEFKIYYFESHGGTGFNTTGVTSLTVNLYNVFSSSQIQSFKNNAAVRYISNDFVIRGQKGNTIQTFKITYVR
jgi:hypothetical protein